MFKSKYLKELGNTKNITNNTTKEKLSFIEKLQKTFDFLSEEPLTVSIKKE